MPITFSSLALFNRANRRLLWLLVVSHLLWCGALLGLWAVGQLVTAPSRWLSALFIALQLYAAAQLLLPALLFHPEQRSRTFYLVWGVLLAMAIWASSRLPVDSGWLPVLAIVRSGLLLLVALLVGAALARYVRRLWELLPVCLVMTLADFASWARGPTSSFARQIEDYYRAPVGPPPAVDMILVKLVLPGSAGLLPVFGLSDWIMVVFFAIVARHHGINDNLCGPPGPVLARRGRIGGYLPVSVIALLAAVLLALATGRFIPVLPFMAVIMLGWYLLRSLLLRNRSGMEHP
ncbi:MAG: hypothetical protein RQ723_07385 [Desulfuromonadales bacterium]|nr:hypothetical protein [Desulfuromonadales bacterium]